MKKLFFVMLALAFVAGSIIAAPFNSGPPITAQAQVNPLEGCVGASYLVAKSAVVDYVGFQDIAILLIAPGDSATSLKSFHAGLALRPNIYYLGCLSVPTLAGFMYGVESYAMNRSNIALDNYVKLDARSHLIRYARDQTALA
jgi:hypothetical protein